MWRGAGNTLCCGHAAGGLVHNRAEDVKLARGYAGRYTKANGPKAQLVKQWMDYLNREK